MPHDLLESELFGHERGAFTNAIADKRGLFEVAHTGTLLPRRHRRCDAESVQVKLLRVLEMQQVMRVGGSAPIAVDVRLITASKIDLEQLVSPGTCSVPICSTGSTSARVASRRCASGGRTCRCWPHISCAASPRRRRSPSPTTRNRRFVTTTGRGTSASCATSCSAWRSSPSTRFGPADLPPEIAGNGHVERLVRACGRCMVDGRMSYTDVVACLETNLLRQALADAGGNRSHAARALGLSLSTLRDKLRKFGLDEGQKARRLAVLRRLIGGFPRGSTFLPSISGPFRIASRHTACPCSECGGLRPRRRLVNREGGRAMENEHGNREFSAEGAVVEILERGGARFAKILIGQGTVLEVPRRVDGHHLGRSRDRRCVAPHRARPQPRRSCRPAATSAAAVGERAGHVVRHGPGTLPAPRLPACVAHGGALRDRHRRLPRLALVDGAARLRRLRPLPCRRHRRRRHASVALRRSGESASTATATCSRSG